MSERADRKAMKNVGLRAVVWGGLVSGVLDLAAAFVQHGGQGVAPVRILQAIASGLLGRAAFQGGAATAAFGAALHFLIAFTATAIYVLASRRLDVLLRRPVLSGVSYGVLIYFFSL